MTDRLLGTAANLIFRVGRGIGTLYIILPRKVVMYVSIATSSM
jgi:hypothetical protein